MHNHRKIRTMLLIAIAEALLITLLGTPVRAQTAAATILGTISDSSGGAIPDAKVQVTNIGTGAVQVVTSDSQGRYRVAALPVGEYQVQCEKIGFETGIYKGVTLTVGGGLCGNKSTQGDEQDLCAPSKLVPLLSLHSGPNAGAICCYCRKWGRQIPWLCCTR